MNLLLSIKLISNLLTSFVDYRKFYKLNSSWSDYKLTNYSSLSMILKYQNKLSKTKFNIKDYNEDIYPLY